jgi:hypothetical protein
MYCIIECVWAFFLLFLSCKKKIRSLSITFNSSILARRVTDPLLRFPALKLRLSASFLVSTGPCTVPHRRHCGSHSTLGRDVKGYPTMHEHLVCSPIAPTAKSRLIHIRSAVQPACEDNRHSRRRIRRSPLMFTFLPQSTCIPVSCRRASWLFEVMENFARTTISALMFTKNGLLH